MDQAVRIKGVVNGKTIVKREMDKMKWGMEVIKIVKK